MTDTPVTPILVHGALTDASVWNGVIDELRADGLAPVAPAMPLRSLAADAAYLSAFLDTIHGPVVLVGHSYGGTVISHPDVARDELRALVFASAFQPDSGESTAELNGRFPGSLLGDATTVVRPSPDGDDLYLRQQSFGDVYAHDLPAATIARMAATQRPIVAAALAETFDRTPTWRDTPSWTLVSTADRSLPADAQRFMAERAGSAVVEVEASHASPTSQPGALAALIRAAAGAQSRQPARSGG